MSGARLRAAKVSAITDSSSSIVFMSPGPDRSVSRADYIRCAHSAIPPCVPEVAHRPAQPLPAGLSDCPILRPPTLGLPALLPTLLCVLARCVRRWSRLGSHKAEQAEMDCEGGAAPRMVG